MSHTDTTQLGLPLRQIMLSREEVDWCRSPITSNPDGGRRLAAEVIGLAIDDYNTLSDVGVIVHGAVPRKLVASVPKTGRKAKAKRLTNPVVDYLYIHEIHELIAFFTTNQLERWINYAGFDRPVENGACISAPFVREKLGITI